MNERTTDRTNQLITIFTRVLCRFILPNWRIKQISQKQSSPDSEKNPEKIHLLKVTSRKASTLFSSLSTGRCFSYYSFINERQKRTILLNELVKYKEIPFIKSILLVFFSFSKRRQHKIRTKSGKRLN